MNAIEETHDRSGCLGSMKLRRGLKREPDRTGKSEMVVKIAMLWEE